MSVKETKVIRVRGVTIRAAVTPIFLKSFLNEATKAMLSVANFDAEYDTPADYRNQLESVYSLIAEIMQTYPMDERPVLLRHDTVSGPDLYNLSVNQLHNAGYIKVSFNVKNQNMTQAVVLVLHPSGRPPVVPAMLKTGKYSIGDITRL